MYAGAVAFSTRYTGENPLRAECPICGVDGPPVTAGTRLLHLVSCPNCHEAYFVSVANGTVSTGSADPPAPLSTRIAPGSVMEGVLDSVDESIRGLPTIPAATQRVIAAIHDPVTTTEQLVKLINEDATLSVRVLRLANSATLGGRQKITDLRLACARLGTRNIANVAHVVAHGHLYRSKNPMFRELMDSIWQHAVATARLAETFGTVIGVGPANLFLAGLVHDIGKPVLLDAMSNRYKGRLGRLNESPDILLKTLDDFAPYIGLRVTQFWNMPVELRFATFYAGIPSAAPEAFRKQAYLVAASSAAAESAGYGAYPTSRDPKTQATELGIELSDELSGAKLVETIAGADGAIQSQLLAE